MSENLICFFSGTSHINHRKQDTIFIAIFIDEATKIRITSDFLTYKLMSIKAEN